MRSRAVPLALFVVAAVAIASSAGANELLVDTRTLRMTDVLTITVSLEGPFAATEDVDIPLENLAIIGDPSVSSEFAWINGDVTRRKTLRYRARPLAPGRARVGPLTLVAPGGERLVLPAVDVTVQADRALASNDAETLLADLLARGRDPLFVVGELDKRTAYVGEPVIVTWMLYNAASIQQWQVVAVPKLADFWVEELARSEQPERVVVGGVAMQRVPIRRVALFPLHSGKLRIDGLSIEAAVMRRVRGGDSPFSIFEGQVVETAFTSASLRLDVRPLPEGPPVDAVGDLTLQCSPPAQRNAGPVVIDVALTGAGNVRAAAPPRFERSVAGKVQIEGGEVSVARDERSFAMTRRWRYLIFPAKEGQLEVPRLTMLLFHPASAERRELACPPAYIHAVMASEASAGGDGAAPPPPPDRRGRWLWIGGALALALIGAMMLPRLRTRMHLRRDVREIVGDGTPAGIRARIERRVRTDPSALLVERSDRGDAWRALRSILDAAERDRDIAVDAGEEIERRVRDVLTSGA